MIDLEAFASSTPRAVDHMPAPSGAPPLRLGRQRDVAELDEALGLAEQGSPHSAAQSAVLIPQQPQFTNARRTLDA